MGWCSVHLTPQGLPKYIYLSPPLIFPTTYNGIRTKNRPVWITPGAAPIRWMEPIRNPRWEQKRTEGYVIVSTRLRLRLGIMLHLRHAIRDSKTWNDSDKTSMAAGKFFLFMASSFAWKTLLAFKIIACSFEPHSAFDKLNTLNYIE